MYNFYEKCKASYLLILSYSLMQAKIVYMQYLVVIRGAL